MIRPRLPRWFAPVEGDLKIGGRYQVENNAGGEIVQCEPPRMFSLTWEFGGDVSWVNVELKAQGPEAVRLTLTHTVKLSPHWEQYGPGAVGVGWELGLLGLALFLADAEAEKLREEYREAVQLMWKNSEDPELAASVEIWPEVTIEKVPSPLLLYNSLG